MKNEGRGRDRLRPFSWGRGRGIPLAAPAPVGPAVLRESSVILSWQL